MGQCQAWEAEEGFAVRWSAHLTTKPSRQPVELGLYRQAVASICDVMGSVASL